MKQTVAGVGSIGQSCGACVQMKHIVAGVGACTGPGPAASTGQSRGTCVQMKHTVAGVGSCTGPAA